LNRRLNRAAITGLSFRRQGLILNRKFCLASLVGLGVLLCALRIGAEQNPPRWTTESVLAMMDKSASDFRSLTADIEQIKYTDVVKDTSKEQGQIFVRRDQKMRIEITKPDPKTILRTGDSLFIFTPKIKRVEEYNLGKHRSMVDQYLRLGFGTKSQDMLRSFDINMTGEEEIDHRKSFMLELTPKSDEVRKQITKIQMWIDPSSWLPVQQKFFETGGGDYFLVKYSSMMKNLKINDAKFKQDWPKDATRAKPRS
jgi:outer membrane lipoprotein-sorting protein